jgi:hypothetical protein
MWNPEAADIPDLYVVSRDGGTPVKVPSDEHLFHAFLGRIQLRFQALDRFVELVLETPQPGFQARREAVRRLGCRRLDLALDRL